MPEELNSRRTSRQLSMSSRGIKTSRMRSINLRANSLNSDSEKGSE
jgi:hypothetical protein